ncbi:MAG TPA: hypothetical protein VGJ64_03080 [Gemmatimonadaceae bacterium]
MTPDNPDPTSPEKPHHRKTPPATPAVQAWLDGEAAREGLASADEQETAEFWSRINAETDQLRRRSTPIHVQQKILSSIPDEPAESRGPPRPASSGSITLRVSTAILAGAALLAVGVLIGAFF